MVRATYQPAVGEFAASHGTQAFEWRAIRLASRIATVTIPRVAYHTIAPGEILVRGGASLRVCDDGPYSADPYLTGLATLTGLSTADYGWNLSPHSRKQCSPPVRLPSVDVPTMIGYWSGFVVNGGEGIAVIIP